MAHDVKKGTFCDISRTTQGRRKMISGHHRSSKGHSDRHNNRAPSLSHLRQNCHFTVILHYFSLKCVISHEPIQLETNCLQHMIEHTKGLLTGVMIMHHSCRICARVVNLTTIWHYFGFYAPYLKNHLG